MGVKQVTYFLLKKGIAAALFCYYKEIKVYGLQDLPKDKPIVFLSNHQNALMDILLIATTYNAKLWYLARADVFANKYLRSFFSFLQMLPVYRIRDGLSQISKNKSTFASCAQILGQGDGILLFPEGNHSLKRQLRPLSKGFTRILNAALALDPSLDLQLVPIGQNYTYPQQAGDCAALYFGKAIALQPLLAAKQSNRAIKQHVFNALTHLTTHIPAALPYETLLQFLKQNNANFTQPQQVNTLIATYHAKTPLAIKTKNRTKGLGYWLFLLCNWPMVGLWRLYIAPKVPEAEFVATFRFVYALVCYPLVYLFSFVLVALWVDIKTACLFVLGHAVINIVLVKLGITSSHQRK